MHKMLKEWAEIGDILNIIMALRKGSKLQTLILAANTDTPKVIVHPALKGQLLFCSPTPKIGDNRTSVSSSSVRPLQFLRNKLAIDLLRHYYIRAFCFTKDQTYTLLYFESPRRDGDMKILLKLQH